MGLPPQYGMLPSQGWRHSGHISCMGAADGVMVPNAMHGAVRRLAYALQMVLRYAMLCMGPTVATRLAG